MSAPEDAELSPDWIIRLLSESTEFARHPLPEAKSQDVCLARISHGKNNRSYRVSIGDRSYFLKRYFSNRQDPRDRRAVEFEFSTYAWISGIRYVSRPIATDVERNFSLFSWVDGRRLVSGDLEPNEASSGFIQAAVQFMLDLNARRDSVDAQSLRNASEACFTIAGHFDRVASRIENLRTICPSDDWDEAAAMFASNALGPALAATRNKAANFRDRELKRNLQFLSPSDFGFHNAILSKSGGDSGAEGLTFVDFEYAGWDDLAKTVCDFFCQVQLPVDEEYLPLFVERLEAGLKASWLRDRVEALLPLYRLKWCCIMLNEFLPAAKLRRDFSNQSAIDRRSEQLQLARASFANWESRFR